MDKRILLTLARESIEEDLKQTKSKTLEILREASPPEVMRKEGAFVTLNRVKTGQLRGCIGNIVGDSPLYQTVYRLAKESAFRDPRFSPLTADELEDITIEISVLTEPQVVQSYAEIVVGRDGVILSQGRRRALFLPQVATEQGWSLPTMLTQLAQKAGLAGDAWKKEGVTFEVFQAEILKENL
ncbi:MAG: AmmeMemoRadiSam system protein A [Sphaerochaetaceae bacterium]